MLLAAGGGQWAGGAADGLRGHRCGAGVGAGVGAGLLLAGGAGGRGDLLRWWCAGVVIVRAVWSSGRAAADPAGRAGGRAWKMGKRKRPGQAARCALLLWPLVCAGVVIVRAVWSSGRAVADPAGRAGGRAWKMGKRKRPGQAARCALLLWPLVCAGVVVLRRVHPGAGGGRWWSVPLFRCRSAAGTGADPGATVPAGNVPAWHGLRWRCSIRCVFAVCRRGQILHLTGVRSRCRALT